MKRRGIFVLVAALLFVTGRANAFEVLPGPVRISVVRVLDGDTFVADAHVWPGQRVRVSVRIRGIDAPELRSRCKTEKREAIRARALLETMLDTGDVSLTHIGGDKYYGLVLADVATPDHPELAKALIDAGVAQPYGGGSRPRVCPVSG